MIRLKFIYITKIISWRHLEQKLVILPCFEQGFWTRWPPGCSSLQSHLALILIFHTISAHLEILFEISTCWWGILINIWIRHLVLKNLQFFSDSFQSDLLQPAFNIFTIFVYEIGFLKSVQLYTWQFSIMIFYVCFIFFLFLVLLFLFSGDYGLFWFDVPRANLLLSCLSL